VPARGLGQRQRRYRRPAVLRVLPAVVPASVALTVGGTAWTRVDDLGTAGPTTPAYQVTRHRPAHLRRRGARRDPGQRRRHPGRLHLRPARRVRRLRQRDQAVDPTAKVCWGTNGTDYSGVATRPMDCVQLHKYTGRRAAHDGRGRHARLGDGALGRTGRADRQPTAHAQGFRPQADIAITEYGIFGSGAGPTEGYLRSLDTGLFTADELLGRHPQRRPARRTAAADSYNPNDLPPGVQAGPTQRNMSTFGYYRTSPPGGVVRHRPVPAPGRRHPGGRARCRAASSRRRPVPASTPYPALSTASTVDSSGRLTVLVVNRDPARDISTTVLPKAYPYAVPPRCGP